MNHEEIRTGNELIKEFMGSTIHIEQKDVKDIPLAFLAVEDLKFHLSWKWLMPVVVKIEEEMDGSVLIEGNYCRIKVDEDTVFENESDTKLEAVWRTLVEFLESRS